ncbi:DUF5060 domain-containing protein [Pelagicoccus enzymogenes]|uniref:DUF5060 domain-containing protein n=1 Tax=Pelagicoccus enzymogenes TaxID=2773457 RepID=UPI00280EB91C|nr:DUF5060 domain-containing protein [Pelagicoccus enzymogenes]MDQ8197906.1 DUF5060 domain-containing protein [Pelagicoccus enzymogenes]
MKTLTHLLSASILLAVPSANAAVVDGELQTWHTITLTFDGPEASETDPSTFLDHRLTVTFSHGETEYVVPGYFAADGNAATSHAVSGNKWQARFTPNRSGKWTYQAELVSGEDIAISQAEGVPAPLSNASGSFTIKPSELSSSATDFRAKGRLNYVGAHYQQFEGSAEYFLKVGLGSPENMLAFDGFDGTYDDAKNPEFPSLGEDQLHHYGPHRQDWSQGDPHWTDEDGHDSKGLIGLINYTAAQGLNSAYLMPLTYEGDGCDVWPWIDPTQRTTFDISKLEQWEIAFSHMQQNGIHILMLLTETENENLFELRDGGAPFADTRKLYYREMIARFGHHLALTWDLGEENGWTDEKGKDVGLGNTHEQRKAFSSFIRQLDPYNHPIKVHEISIVEIYPQLAGYPDFDGPTLQRHEHYNKVILDHLKMSRDAGHPWLVSMDEPLGWEYGLRPDADDPTRDHARKDVLWGTLMAGGSGVSWYFGWQNNAPTSDLSSEDLRVRETMWKQSKVAHDFFSQYVPFHRMRSANDLVEGEDDYVFAQPRQTYVVYLKNGGTASLNLANVEGIFDIRWYDPIKGGPLQLGSIAFADASTTTPLGTPPHSPEQDWAILITAR